MGTEDGPVLVTPLIRRLRLRGVCLWPLAIVVAERDSCLIRHEQLHWDEQRRSPLWWYVKYVYYFVQGYRGRNHPMERKAYEAQDICNSVRNTSNS